MQLGIIRVNNQLDALFNVFISVLYMFRATQCSSSGESIVSIHHLVYRVSQEEWTKFRESGPYVKLYRYNPKHLYPKLNDYGDNGQRKVWASGGVHVLYAFRDAIFVHCACPATRHSNAVTLANALQHGSSDVTR